MRGTSKRRLWMQGSVASVVMLGVGVGVVAVAHDRIEQRDPWRGIAEHGALWRAIGDAMGESRAAEFLAEPRVERFAVEQERWIRGPLHAAVARALPGVVLEQVECRATTCRWSYLAPDEYSGHALVLAPWDAAGQATLTRSTVRRASIIAASPVVRDDATVAWFDALTPDVVRWRLAARGRVGPDVATMVEAWERAHGR